MGGAEEMEIPSLASLSPPKANPLLPPTGPNHSNMILFTLHLPKWDNPSLPFFPAKALCTVGILYSCAEKHWQVAGMKCFGMAKGEKSAAVCGVLYL